MKTNTLALLFPNRFLTPAVRIRTVFAVVMATFSLLFEKRSGQLNIAIFSNGIVNAFL